MILEVFRGLEVIKKEGVNSADHGLDKRDAEKLSSYEESIKTRIETYSSLLRKRNEGCSYEESIKTRIET